VAGDTATTATATATAAGQGAPKAPCAASIGVLANFGAAAAGVRGWVVVAAGASWQRLRAGADDR
jgi:hypothetical protein